MDVAEPLVFVDLETTGGNPVYHRITEVAIIRVENGVVVDEWSSLVNPGCPIPAYIESFTGISSEMVVDAPRFADLATTVYEKLRGAVFVAHNARFDYSFLRSEFLKAGLHFSATAMCTVKLSRRLFPMHVRHNLDAVMERHGLKCDARHRALGDAQVLRDFWFLLRREIPEAVLAEAGTQSLLAEAQLPSALPAELADELPEGAGVYRFFGEEGTLLYIGRGNSLRTRVLGQLCVGQRGARDQKLADLVRRVDWVETAGELGAMLIEADWIRSQKPVYNRRLQGSAESVTLRIAADNSGRTDIERIDSIEPKDLTQCFGVFHRDKDARKALTEIAHAKQLCLKVLGLEQSAGSCFALQMGKCRGACVGGEALILHNTRLRMALSALKIKSWPFAGRIALREPDRRGRQEDEIHVLDHWTYLGTARSDEELSGLSAKPADAGFDVDVYKILMRYFANHPKPAWFDLRSGKLEHA
jgi:DNA polymerase-3 subunit epsilon